MLDVKENDKIVILTHEIGKVRKMRRVTGKVYQVTSGIIVIQLKNYKESFSKVNFKTGYAKIISINGTKVQQDRCS